MQANLPNIQETHNDQDFAGVGELKLFGNNDNIDDDLGGDFFDELFGNVQPTDISGSPVSKFLISNTHYASSFLGQPGQVSTRKAEPFWILMKQRMMGWQWHQLDRMQIICTSLTGNHTL